MNANQNDFNNKGGNGAADVPETVTAFVPLTETTKKHNWGRIVNIVFGIIVLTVIALYAVAVSSPDDVRGRAQNATVRQSASSVRASVVLCADSANGLVLPPHDNGVLCRGSDFTRTWPEIGLHGGSWGGCEFFVHSDSKDLSFQYCAILPNGTVFKCIYDNNDNTSGGCAVEAR